MDPNETLRLYREAQSRARALADAARPFNSRDNSYADAIAACDAFAEADEHMSNLLDWLGKGGFAPDWVSARFAELLDRSGTE